MNELKLKKDFEQKLKKLAEVKYCTSTISCERCPLNMFDNEDTPCAENAKNLLSLLGE